MMKRIHLFLLCLIFLSIAAKVSVAPGGMEYPALTADYNDQKGERFFKYKVNQIQDYNNPEVTRCKLTSSRCCQA
ncbi:hypothetical protein [Christiangramia crocea]|uniref:Uncharacterized protein n=1 Tax=Christiangramia crocea TaxID=2904124 RepID=A0A9X2A7I1_9FLAO|nr:hypothetical protein [Gramella crocea]MCG9973110.1 hypothetical protein [Gramella crocea]